MHSWGHCCRFLRRKPSVQLALLVILLMRLLHFKSSEMLTVLSMDFSLLLRECADLVGRSSSISVSCSLCNISLRWISCHICRPKVLVIWDLLTHSGRSFMWHKNSSGPNTVPCGNARVYMGIIWVFAFNYYSHCAVL